MFAFKRKPQEGFQARFSRFRLLGYRLLRPQGFSTLHRVLAETAAVSPEMATRLARLSGTTPQFWLALQQQYDLWHAEQALARVLPQIPTHSLPPAVRAEIGLPHDRSIQVPPQSADRGRGAR